MSFDVSEFARPVRIADAQDLKGLSDADMQRVALGTPIAIGQRYYSVRWDKAHARAELKCLFAPGAGAGVGRDRQQEKMLAAGLKGRLPDQLTREIRRADLAVDVRASRASMARQAAIEHVAAGGLLRLEGEAGGKSFAVVVDKRGKAEWAAISESRWPALCALRDFLACLTPGGRAARRKERECRRQLDAYLPAAQVKARRESIEAQRAAATTGAASADPHAAMAFHQRIANPHAVMQFLRFERDGMRHQDSDGRSVVHHVAMNKNLQAAPVLDQLFQSTGRAALEGGWYLPGGEDRFVPPIVATDYEGNTPLHYAVQHADRRTVQRFLQEAAQFRFDFDLGRNVAGETVLDVARERGDPEIEAMVRRFAGAPSSAKAPLPPEQSAGARRDAPQARDAGPGLKHPDPRWPSSSRLSLSAP